MDHIVQTVLRFDRFAVDLVRGCLRDGDQEIELRPKTFEVLRYLAQNAGQLVRKHELFEAVWPNVSVGDDSLVQCIRELRQKLGDVDHRLIKTVSRRGYLLDATVSAQTPQSAAESAVQVPELRQRLVADPDLWRRILRAIAAHRLPILGAAFAVLVFVGSIFLLSRLPALFGNPGLVYPPYHEVTVVAVDGATQTPIVGAHIFLLPHSGRTDAAGIAKVRVTRGRYKVFVSSFDYAPHEDDIDVAGDVTIRVELAKLAQ
jgi:DNA-binding winged helix-turn-helix (wHTH) protein